jgi:hypothetical protein
VVKLGDLGLCTCFILIMLLNCPDIMQCRLKVSTSDPLSPSQCALLRSGRGKAGEDGCAGDGEGLFEVDVDG